ncbi:598_t:CDS:2, partial [Cetraspora pellucida]
MISKIKAAQSEKNRLSMLLAEYTDDIVTSQSDCAIKSRKDSLWFLVTKLLSAFNHPNPATHYLFEDAPEISENGINNILSFYEIELIVQQGTSALPSEISLPKQTRRTTTEAEKGILAQLLDHEENLPEAAVIKVFWELQPISSDWTSERIKLYWRNNR